MFIEFCTEHESNIPLVLIPVVPSLRSPVLNTFTFNGADLCSR